MAAQVSYPVKVQAHLDEGLSRWMWLFKWFLAIPHLIVLAFLWMAFALMSVLAFFAILFTGRYPRSIFEFNVGVMRWSWRVAYYSYGALGTDRYPPFTLDEVPDYPVHLSVDYPERLSRGLVLVKWWLLAIPHYIIVGILAGGAWMTFRGDNWEVAGFSLIGILTLIAGFSLAFTGTYPKALFDLILGFNRWVLRVAAYAGLMTDSYPPFRLDTGGDEPDGDLAVGAPGGSSPSVGSVHEPKMTGAHRRGWTAGPIITVVIGAVFGFMSLGALVGGGLAAWVDNTQRVNGFVTSPTVGMSSDGYAIVTDSIEIHADGPDWVLPQSIIGDARLRITGSTADIFVGVAPTDAVNDYLDGVARTIVTDLNRNTEGDLPVTAGSAPAEEPLKHDIWLVADSGVGTRAVTWPVEQGSWSLVVMNTDASRGIDIRGDIGAELPILGGAAIVLLILGGFFLIIAIALIGAAIGRAGRTEPTPTT